MIRNWPRALLAVTCGLSLATPALAEEPVRLENSLTSGGLNIAPRYLDQVGDIDLNLLGGYLNYPNSAANLVGGQFALQARILDQVQLLANMGPLTEIGLRGPLADLGWVKLGWDAHYRSDLYFLIQPGPGRTAPMFGLSPMPGSSAYGLEGQLNAMHSYLGFNLFVSPLLAVMSNRTTAGLAAGLDWNLDRLGLGYGFSYRANVVNPNQSTEPLAASELQHSVGVRYSLTERLYAQANYYLQPADSYGIPSQTVLAGVGMRLLGSTPQAPAAAPMPEPTPAPVEVRPAVPVHFLQIEGRLYNSRLKDGQIDQPLTVGLKKRVGKAFVNVKITTQTDASGRYVFRNFGEEGEYQVVFRNPEGRADTVGVIVSEAVRAVLDQVATVNLDLAWDDVSFEEQLASPSVNIRWGTKPGFAEVMYQGILREDPNDSRTDVLPFPAEPTIGATGSFEVSSQIRGRKLFYFIKFWKQGGEFNGSNYYGQSKPRELQLP